MDLPTPKQIKALADACRKAGIVSFKAGSIEFTLGAALPQKQRKSVAPISSKKSEKSAPASGDTIQTDELSPEALLFWSSASADDKVTDSDAGN